MVATHRKTEKGAAMVEFALVLPLLLILVFGIIEFSLLLYDQQMITNASREGARFGIVQDNPRKSEAEVQAVVDAYCASHLVTFGVATPVTTTAVPIDVNGDGVTNFGDDLRVTVTYDYGFLVLPNFITSLLGTKTLRAEALMKYE